MLIPIRCFTCGKVLADKWAYYQKRVAELERQLEDAADDQPSTSSSRKKNFSALETGIVLDELGLTRICCRRHLLGHVDVVDII